MSSLATLGLTGFGFDLKQDHEKLKNIRSSLGLKKGLVYMNTGSLGPTPSWVTQKEFDLIRELELNPVNNNWGPLGDRMELVRSKAAVFLNCESSEVVLTRNTTEGLNMISATLSLKQGDEILTTGSEHGGAENGINYAAKVSGATIVKVDLPMPAMNKEEVIAKIVNAITDNTKVLLLSQVTTIEGMQMPLEEISNAIRGKDIYFIVDGAQSAGMLQIDLKKMDVDAFATSGHKWLMGPKETGLLFVKKSSQDRIQPVFTFSGFQTYSASSGTRNVAHQIALGEMLDWHMQFGTQQIENTALQLGQYCYEKLSAVKNIKIISPSDRSLRSALISFTLQKSTNRELYNHLKSKNIIVKVLPKHNAVRLSNHIFNTEGEVDKTISEIQKFLS